MGSGSLRAQRVSGGWRGPYGGRAGPYGGWAESVRGIVREPWLSRPGAPLPARFALLTAHFCISDRPASPSHPVGEKAAVGGDKIIVLLALANVLRRRLVQYLDEDTLILAARRQFPLTQNSHKRDDDYHRA
jgi:hypothetical protein